MLRKMRRAQSTIEFLTLLIFIMAGFLVFQKYISRGFAGRWKGVGDSLGGGAVYSAKKTHECEYDFRYFNLWYDVDCYEDNCDCLTVKATQASCQDCIQACAVTSANKPAYCQNLCDMSCAAFDFSCQNDQNQCEQNCMANAPTFDYCQDT